MTIFAHISLARLKWYLQTKATISHAQSESRRFAHKEKSADMSALFL